MRPRHKAAENDLRNSVMAISVEASMRPRHKAAENVRSTKELWQALSRLQ